MFFNRSTTSGILVALTALSGASLAHAQVEQWVATTSLSDQDWAADVHVDPSGDVVVTGNVRFPGTVYTDVLTVKFGPSGNELWSAVYDGPAGKYDRGAKVRIDANGDVYVLGTSQADMILIKYSSDGSQLWLDRYSPPADSEARRLELAPDGSIYVLGARRLIASGPWDAFITLRYQPDGTRSWERIADNGFTNPYKEDDPVAMAVDGASNVYVTGRSHSGTVTAYQDYLTLKYDSAGTLLWSARHDAGLSDFPRNLAISASGDAYVVGEAYFGTTNVGLMIKYDGATGAEDWVASRDLGWIEDVRALAVDPSGNACMIGAAQFFGSNNYDWGVTLFEGSTGAELWTARYSGIVPSGSDRPGRVVADSQGNFYVAGSGPGADPVVFPAANNDFVTLRYDVAGNATWEARYHANNEGLAAMALDAEENVYVTGFTAPHLGDPGTAKTLTIKYSPPALPWVELGGGLAGGLDVPSLTATGPMTAGSLTTVELLGAKRVAPAALVVGLSLANTPFKGGTLVPWPDFVFAALSTDGAGEISLSANWPAGVAPETVLTLQYWIVDAGGPVGFSASNAVSGTTP